METTTTTTDKRTSSRYATDLLTIVLEKEFQKMHDVLEGAPDEWAKGHGATHTLVVPFAGYDGDLQTRPAKLYKSVLYVGYDESADGGIEWKRWSIRQIAIARPGTATPPRPR